MMTRDIKFSLSLGALLLAGCLASDAARAQMPSVRREERVIGDRVGGSYGIFEGGARVNANVTQLKPIEQVVILLDGSGSMAPIYPRIAEELRRALPARIGAPTAIVRFSAQKTFIQDFTTSRAALESALANEQQLWAGSNPGDDTMKATTNIYGTLVALAETAPDKLTHFIVVTDGNDSLNSRVDMARLVNENVVISYLNWGYRSFSARVDEKNAVVVAGNGSRAMEIPNVTLRFIAQRTGGDLLNYSDWKKFGEYFKRRLSAPGALYRATWDSMNPEVPFSLSAR
ncbi:MAG: hypothetical protein CFK52_13255 [Chloracidobacterium sp. CP2_5A]|nr:MAG: hypothetical protein CFK52_13255 [Chloracidobacterium sp. CP2_5A]